MHCRAFLYFFSQSKCFASNSMYLNWQKQGYFLSCCLPLTGYCAVILQPICSRISHSPALPGWCQQMQSVPGARAEGGLWICTHCQSFLSAADSALDPYSLVFPCSPPQNTIPGFSTPRFSNGNFARTLPCSVTEQIKHPLNCWTLKHHPQPLPGKD